MIFASSSIPASREPRGRRSGFTLTELLVVASIMVILAAVTTPVLAVILRETRQAGAVARLQAGMLQTRNLLTDLPIADFALTSPLIAGATYAGTGMLVRWDDTKGDYEVSYIVSAQAAKNPALQGTLRGGLVDPTTNAQGFLVSAGPTPSGDYAYCGYSLYADLEPMTLGPGIRVAGLRRKSGFGTPSSDGQTELEIVQDAGGGPVSSFAICMSPIGACIPPAQAIYVNLQASPPDAASRPTASCWNVWDTTMYDAANANTGAHAGQYVAPTPGNGATAGVGEGFVTALPILLVYRDDDLPLSGNAPSARPWRVANAKGAMVLNPALDPNEVLAQTRGRLLVMPFQAGTPITY